MLPTSEAKDDIHLTVKEELNDTNIKDMEGINIGSKQNLYSRRPCEGEEGVQQRIQPTIFNMWNSSN